MADVDVGKAVVTNIRNELEDFSVAPQETDGSEESNETRWDNVKWSQYLGYYKSIPKLTATIDAKATWTVGKGFTADENTSLILGAIKGWGKDTFNTILENAIRTYQIGGDFFAEIILDGKGFLINLKPLDPGSITIVTDKQGLVIRYEQSPKVKGQKNFTFEPEEIFHLARNRVADEIHGTSLITALENIILSMNESMEDQRIGMHRNVVPQVVWHIDEDDTTKIDAFTVKVNNLTKNREHIVIPMGTVEREVAAVAPNATLNPMSWIEFLNSHISEVTGVPGVILGNSKGFTEAAVKIEYLAFQQTVEEEQLFIEEQVLMQLNLVIELTFPVSLENEALSDKPKEEGPVVENRGIEQEQAMQPNDTTAETEGKR